jgi:hypothetical protein
MDLGSQVSLTTYSRRRSAKYVLNTGDNQVRIEWLPQINQFKLSPDGHYIAFCSTDEPSDEEEKKEKEKDDARVWGERKGEVNIWLTLNLRPDPWQDMRD